MRNSLLYVIAYFALLFCSCEKEEHKDLRDASLIDTVYTSVTTYDTVKQTILITTINDTLEIDLLDRHVLNQFVDAPTGLEYEDNILIISNTDPSARYTITEMSIPRSIGLNQNSGEIFVNNASVFENTSVGRVELEILVESDQYDPVIIEVIIRIKDNLPIQSSSELPVHYFSFNGQTFEDYYNNTAVSTIGNNGYGPGYDGALNNYAVNAVNDALSGFKLEDVDADIEQDFTLSFWFKLRTGEDFGSPLLLFSSRHDDAINEAGGFTISISKERELITRFRRKTDVNTWSNIVAELKSEPDLIEFDVWFHCVLIKTDGLLQMYLDDQLLIRESLYDIPTNNSKWMIGTSLHEVNTTEFQFNGWMDDIIIYDRALSEEELLTLKNFVPTAPLN